MNKHFSFVKIYPELVSHQLEIGPILDCKIKDRKCCRLEVKLVDPSSKETFIALTLWEPLLQMFTLEWKPCATGKLSFQIKNKTRDDYFLFKSILELFK